MQRISLAGEAMNHQITKMISMAPDDLCKARVSLSFVQEHWHPAVNRQFQMAFERSDLLVPWREVPIEVEPGFPHGPHALLAEQGPNAGERLAR